MLTLELVSMYPDAMRELNLKKLIPHLLHYNNRHRQAALKIVLQTDKPNETERNILNQCLKLEEVAPQELFERAVWKKNDEVK